MVGKRRSTGTVNIGGVDVGGESPISIQSMTNTRTDDIPSTIRQIKEIHRAGGELVRAVSYTHLDVYKRQPWNMPIGPERSGGRCPPV